MATATQPKPPQVVNIPNLLTAGRFGLSFVLFAFIHLNWWLGALVVFILAAITDWLDGYTARIMNLSSSLGRMFDPLVDKIMVCGAFVFLLPIAGSGLAAWMVTLVVARELAITGIRGFIEQQGAHFGADWFGKAKMVLQCAVLVAIFWTLFAAESLTIGKDLFPIIRDVLIYLMLATTALSGFQYLWRAFGILKADA